MSDLSQRLSPALADRYRIERPLGRGGMATVFLAEDLKHHRRVAIKVLDPEVAAAIGPERFLREIETIARLTHPHILPLHDSGAADGLLFYVMPYVEGESLRERLAREKQLPVDDALRVAREVADALSYAHSQGVVHRDVKPENILLESGHAVVADFGIARAVAAAGADKLTATGIAVGTPAYMSPEQAAGSRDLDGRSDLYSLGCVLYEMLAGQPPFSGPTAESLVHQHLNASPRPVTEIRPAVPAAVAAALQRALAKNPADRFNPVALFGEALGSQATTAATPVPVAPTPRSHRARWVASVAVLVLALAGIAAWQRWGPFADWLGGGGHHPPARKDWILVAEFDGPADDTTLATAARSLVSAALDQSEIVATVPRDQIQFALQQAGKPASTRVSAEVARELAYRRAVRAVLEGEIQRIGASYSVVLRVVDAESLKVIVTERGSAKNEDALIPALGRLAGRLRRDLGERRGAIAATQGVFRLTRSAVVTTPSFEAYRLYVRADQLNQSNQIEAQRTAVLLTREALALDPGFSSAWDMLGILYTNLGERDSALAAFQEELRRPERTTPRGRLATQARVARLNGDLEGALATFDLLLQDNPASYRAWNTRAVTLEGLGRFEEALESIRRAEELWPIGPTVTSKSNEAFFLCDLGRVEEARRLARTLPGLMGLTRLIMAETVATEWARVESLAVVARREPGFENSGIPLSAISARAGRGAFREAADAYVRAEQATVGSRNSARRARVLLGVMSAGAIPLPADDGSKDTTTAMLLTRGLRAAAAGDRATARRMLAMVRARPMIDQSQQGATPALLDAWIRGLDARWSEVVSVLLPAASWPAEGDAQSPMGVSAVRWTLADAYERSGLRDSAAMWLERITSDPAPVFRDSYYRGVAQSAAHHRLVLLYARMGRLADAERHLVVLERWWDRPDDIARRMLDEARAAVAALRASAPRGK